MKKLFNLIALSIVLFCTSCLESENLFEQKLGVNQFYIVSGGNRPAYAHQARMFTYNLDYNTVKADITMDSVRFSPMMPAITMELKDLPFVASQSGTRISGVNLVPEVDGNPMPDYTLTYFNARLATSSITNMTSSVVAFTVNNSINVSAFPIPTTFEHNSQTYVNNPISSDSNSDYTFDTAKYAIYVNTNTGLAQLCLFNVKFADKMPALNMIFPDLEFKPTNSGFNISKNEFIPCLNNVERTPAPNYPISQFNASVVDGRVVISFICSVKQDEHDTVPVVYNVNSTAYMFASETTIK